MTQALAKRIKVGIVGGTGYTGVELLRILSQHPNAELTAITSPIFKLLEGWSQWMRIVAKQHPPVFGCSMKLS